MSRIHIRCLLIVAVCQLLLGPSASPAQDWDPISFGVNGGSLVGSIAYQVPSGKDSGIKGGGSCDPGEVSVRAFKSELTGACSSGAYFPRGRRCAECKAKKGQDDQARGTRDEAATGEWVVKDAKNPNAFEFEFGSFDSPVRGSEDDVFFIGAGYRRFLLQAGNRDRLRFSAGVGLAVYYLDPGEKLGFNARVGAEIGLNPRARDPENLRTYVTLDLTLIHHRLDSDLDTTGGMVGIRLHFPGKRP